MTVTGKKMPEGEKPRLDGVFGIVEIPRWDETDRLAGKLALHGHDE